MTEPGTIPPNVHPEVAVLPWYLNGTLSAAERAAVSAHLRECLSCRTELEDLVRMNEQIRHAVGTGPLPSPDLAQSVLSRVRQDARRTERMRPDTDHQAEPRGFVAQIDHWLRGLFAPQWVPTAVAALMLAQLSLLTWSLIQPPATDLGTSGAITSRGLGSPTARLAIEFQPSASMQDMQTLLQTLHGRVIDGPMMNGTYIIEVPASGLDAAERHITSLQNRGELIRRLERVAP
jgi:hypothetical protein